MSSKIPEDSAKTDSRGQFAKSTADGTNNGMTSAEPRVLSKEGEAHTAGQQASHGRDVEDEQSRKEDRPAVPAKLDVNDGDVTI